MKIIDFESLIQVLYLYLLKKNELEILEEAEFFTSPTFKYTLVLYIYLYNLSKCEKLKYIYI